MNRDDRDRLAFFGLVACWLSTILVYTGCSGEQDSIEPHAKYNLTYRYALGDFVEHFLFGKALVVSQLKDKTGDVLYKIKYKNNANEQKTCNAWEHELKPLTITNYPAKGEDPKDPDVDVEAQMMEERIEKRVLERLATEKVAESVAEFP